MKYFTILLILCLPFMSISQDLTDEWTDDNGACYKIRQTGNRIFWFMDSSPRVMNVFSGYIAGNTISGEWADIPGGNMMGSGSISLRVESRNRLVKTNQNGNYGGNVWTRGQCSKCNYNLSGEWRGIHEAKNWNETGYYIIHDDKNITLGYRGDGTSATAKCVKNILYLTGWNNGTGEITNNGNRINFSNGSYWLKL